MSINIAGFVKRLLPTLSKSDLESDLDVSIDSLSVVVSAYQDLKQTYEVVKFKSPKSKELIDLWYKEFKLEKSGLKISSTKNFANDMVTVFTNMTHNVQLVKKEVEDISNEVIVSQALTAYRSNILRAVEHYFFATRFALDFLNHLYTLEAIHGGIDLVKEARPNAKQTEFVEKNLWIFARIVSVYGQTPENFSNLLEDISKITINQTNVEDALDVYRNTKIDMFDDLPSGFMGSPIYTVRLIFSQWEADRYKQLKDKKKLLELRSLHLKLLNEQGTGDMNTERELTYLQKRITDIDYKISKIEGSVRD